MSACTSASKISCDGWKISSGHWRSKSIVERGLLFIFCAEREVEFLILHIEHSAKRKGYFS